MHLLALAHVEGDLIWINLHPGRLTWNLQITHLERKMIFQTSMIMFHVNLQGCSLLCHNSDIGISLVEVAPQNEEGSNRGPGPANAGGFGVSEKGKPGF